MAELSIKRGEKRYNRKKVQGGDKMLKNIHMTFKREKKGIEKWIYILILFLGISFLGSYESLKNNYSNEAAFVLLDWVLPQYTFDMGTKVLLKEYQKFLHEKILVSPFALFYETMPHYRVETGIRYTNSDGILGYFKLPTTNQLLSLEEEPIDIQTITITKKQDLQLGDLKNTSYLLEHFITGDADLKIDHDLLSLWDFEELAQRQLRINEQVKGPKILLFHTHIQERYADEEPGEGAGVVAVAKKLKDTLETVYGIEVLHVTDSFYKENSSSVTGNYERMAPVIENILRQYPSIEVCIDIHRDGVRGADKFLGEINGEDVAKIMFVNGLCMQRDLEGNLTPMRNLTNDYLEDNLAFSLQAQVQGLKYYPDMMRKIYYNAYRYSLHMKPLSLLLEVGNQNNTLEEALNAVDPVADILAKVLEKD
jgi:stage II sporulation protein P